MGRNAVADCLFTDADLNSGAEREYNAVEDCLFIGAKLNSGERSEIVMRSGVEDYGSIPVASSLSCSLSFLCSASS